MGLHLCSPFSFFWVCITFWVHFLFVLWRVMFASFCSAASEVNVTFSDLFTKIPKTRKFFLRKFTFELK